jgi:ubiquinone/menaquinone biosynthesis C-methylase UbiE
MTQENDLTRLRAEYEKRKERFAGSDVYSWLNPANLFAIHRRQQIALKALRKYGFSDLTGVRLLEIGCGGGGVLTEYLGFGFLPGHLFGVDLLYDRLEEAHQRLPGSHLINSDGQHLPFLTHSFDLVMQYTALSSILDPDIRQRIGHEMVRVLNRNGLILWYDFWLNPTNPQTHGIRPGEIRRMFPGCTYDFNKITLAPPIARRVVPLSWMLSLFLEKLGIFNSHFLVIIRPSSYS